ncbi:MAG TPA: hypothetical protein VK188_15515 [Holophaga sp.]|nr:hypothetical protein [Holophaga sp.]
MPLSRSLPLPRLDAVQLAQVQGSGQMADLLARHFSWVTHLASVATWVFQAGLTFRYDDASRHAKGNLEAGAGAPHPNGQETSGLRLGGGFSFQSSAFNVAFTGRFRLGPA